MKSKAEHLEILETAFSSLGKAHDPEALKEFPTFAARHIQADARLAEALSAVTDTPQIEQIRCLLYRGDIEAAEELLNRQSQQNESQLYEAEFKFELARFLAISARWSEALTPLQEFLNSKPPAASIITAIQVRALCLFEVGAFAQAAKDVELLQSLEKVLPHTPALKYVIFIRAKLMARTHTVESARRELSRYISKYIGSEKFNWDLVLTWARTEIDLHRLEKKDASRWSMLALLAADKLGDKQYYAHALLDLTVSKNKDVATWATEEMARTPSAQSGRVRILIEEMKNSFAGVAQGTGVSGISTTGHSLISAVQNDGGCDFNLPHDKSVQETLVELSVGSILVKEEELLLDCSKVSLSSLASREQILNALLLLDKNPKIEKAQFFENLWNLRFNQEVHDPAIRTLLKRIRERVACKIDSKSGSLAIRGFLVV